MDLQRARFNMVEQQIRPWNVLDRSVLDTVMAVPRENFVPEQFRHLAFTDMNLPIGSGQVMMQPKVEARMLQELEPEPTDRALLIGTGTGYMTALVANLVAEVQSVEIRSEFVTMARDNLAANDVSNVTVVEGDGSDGWDAGFAPDCVIIAGSMPVLSRKFKTAMAVGGRLVAVVGQDPVMNAVLVVRQSELAWYTRSLFETSLPALDNVFVPDKFVF